jgi:D-alanine--poly(phosphoribitol) ligase subunit 2
MFINISDERKGKMEDLFHVLIQFNDNIDYKNETALLTDGIIDSVSLVELVTELEKSFFIDIPLEEIIPENFNSIENIWGMIERLQNIQK